MHISRNNKGEQRPYPRKSVRPLSVIIPVFNEEGIIGKTITYLRSAIKNRDAVEIIVVDGGSSDHSVKEAQAAGVLVIRAPKGRATQMNAGARAAKGAILYFLHADSTPPQTFIPDIHAAIDKGFQAGCFRLRFDKKHWFLKANSWFTRFDVNAFRYGDQSLFVERDLFNKSGGFSEKCIVMEDNEFIARLKRLGAFIVMQKEVLTSARKYVVNGVFRMQAVFYLIYIMYQLGFSQERLVSTFRKLVQQDKL